MQRGHWLLILGQSLCLRLIDKQVRNLQRNMYVYMVVDLKVLVSSVYDDDPEHIKISFGESFFSSWRK